MREETSAGFVIVSNRKVLLLGHREGHADFPKGHVEKGENALDAAYRELEEEAGIPRSMVEFVPDFRHEMEYFFRDGKELVKKRVIFFLGKVGENAMKLARPSWEHSWLRWVEIGQAIDEVKFKEQKELLERVMKKLNLYHQQ